MENGKLIVSSVNWDGAVVNISNLTSDRYAVEFDVKIEPSPEGVCVFENMNQEIGKSWRATSAIFLSNGQANYSWSANFDTAPENIVLSYFDVTRTNTVMLIILGDQIAAFINGQIAYTIINPNGSAVYVQQQLSAYGTNGCEFDNYKYWGLSGVNFNP